MQRKNTQDLKYSRIVASAWLLATVCLFGCTQTISGERHVAQALHKSVTDTERGESALVIDLGYIDLGSNMAFGLPLSRLGLPHDANIESIESSCECVQGEVAVYRGPEPSSSDRVLRIKIREEANGSDGERQESVVPLSVVLSIQCLNGLSRSVIVRFVASELLI